MPTLIISGLIGLLVVAIIINEIKKRKSGKGGCSCGCGGCAMKDKCHNNK